MTAGRCCGKIWSRNISAVTSRHSAIFPNSRVMMAGNIQHRLRHGESGFSERASSTVRGAPIVGGRKYENGHPKRHGGKEDDCVDCTGMMVGNGFVLSGANGESGHNRPIPRRHFPRMGAPAACFFWA
jgi:hypothetical protein